MAVEQLARLEDNVKHLRRQQQGALEEARRLRRLEESQGQLTRAQALAALDLARLQHSLQADTARLGQQLTGAGAFALALGGAAADMGRAAESLDRRETGSATQDAQRGAIRRLDLLLEALKPEPPAAQSENAGGGNQGGQQGPQGDRIQNVAQLKLLKFLQQEINVRTEQLQQAVAAAGKPTEEQLRESAELSRQQGRLADVVLESLQPVRPNPEPDDRARVGNRPARHARGGEQSESARPTPARRRSRSSGSVVDDLDRLIEQARKKAGQCSPSAGQPPPGASRSSVLSARLQAGFRRPETGQPAGRLRTQTSVGRGPDGQGRRRRKRGP